MEPVVLVQFLGEDDEVLSVQRFEQLPLRCGRSYSSDLLFNDPYVCEEHFTIEKTESGQLRVVDESSLNGLIELRSRSRKDSITIDGSIVLKVGTTFIRIVDSSKTQAASIPLPSLHIPARRPRITLWHALAAFMLFVAIFYLQVFVMGYRTGSNQSFATITKAIVGGLCIFIPWAAAWALMGKVIIRKFRFASHLFMVATLTSAYMVCAFIPSFLEFAYGEPLIGKVLGIMNFGIAFFALTSLHLFYSTRMKRSKRWLTAGIVSLILIGIFGVMELEDSFDFSSRIPLSSKIKPPWFRLKAGISTTDLANRVESLKETFE